MFSLMAPQRATTLLPRKRRSKACTQHDSHTRTTLLTIPTARPSAANEMTEMRG